MPKKATKRAIKKKLGRPFSDYKPLMYKPGTISYATRSQKMAHFLNWALNNGWSGVFITPKTIFNHVFLEAWQASAEKNLRSTFGHVKAILRNDYELGFQSSVHGIRALSSPEEIMEHQLASDIKKHGSSKRRVDGTIGLLDVKKNQFGTSENSVAAKATFLTIKKNVDSMPSLNNYVRLLIK